MSGIDKYRTVGQRENGRANTTKMEKEPIEFYVSRLLSIPGSFICRRFFCRWRLYGALTASSVLLFPGTLPHSRFIYMFACSSTTISPVPAMTATHTPHQPPYLLLVPLIYLLQSTRLLPSSSLVHRRVAYFFFLSRKESCTMFIRRVILRQTDR